VIAGEAKAEPKASDPELVAAVRERIDRFLSELLDDAA